MVGDCKCRVGHSLTCVCSLLHTHVYIKISKYTCHPNQCCVCTHLEGEEAGDDEGEGPGGFGAAVRGAAAGGRAVVLCMCVRVCMLGGVLERERKRGRVCVCMFFFGGGGVGIGVAVRGGNCRGGSRCLIYVDVYGGGR